MIISMAATVDAAVSKGATTLTFSTAATPVEDPTDESNEVTQISLNSTTSNTAVALPTNIVVNTAAMSFELDLYLPETCKDESNYIRFNSKADKSWTNLFYFGNGEIQFYSTNNAYPKASITPKKWYSVKVVFDPDSEIMTCYIGERGTGILNHVGTANVSNTNVLKDNTKAYNNLQIVKGSADLSFYLDNVTVTAYAEPYAAFNKCTTWTQAKTEVDLYESLGLFDGGDKRAQYDDEALYSSLIGKNFISNAAAQEAYNEVYSALSYGDGSTLYSNWDFENNSLLDSVYSKSFMGENTASYFSIADDPTDASNKVAKMTNTILGEPFNNISELRNDAVNKKIRYAVLDMDLYKEAPQNSSKKNYLKMTTGSGSERQSLWVTTSNNLYFNSGIDKDYFDSINNKWLNLRTVIDLQTGEASSYLFYEGEYRRFYSIEANSLSYAGLTNVNALNRISILFAPDDDDDWTAIYFDNVSFKGYTDFYKAVNTAPAALSLPAVTAAYDSADIVDMPDAIDDMTDAQLTAFFTAVKGTSTYTKDSDVMPVIYKHMADNFADEDDVYLYEYTATANDLYDYTIVLNKDDISETSAVVIAAAYDENILLDVASFEYTGSLEKYSAVSVKDLNLDVSGANIVKIFVWDNFGNCVPLVNAVQKKNELKLQATYFPNYTKKAVTFTFDDANETYDSKVIDILKPAGMKATFNLATHNLDLSTDASVAEIQDLYSGFEVANHTKYHPYPWDAYKDNEAYGTFTEFKGNDATDSSVVIALKDSSTKGYLAVEDEYIKCIDAGHNEIEMIFGKGSVAGFAWPGSGPANYTNLSNYVNSKYDMIRASGKNEVSKTTFALPKNWKEWMYNANYTNVYSRAQEFANLEIADSDELRWLSIGVHALGFYKEANVTEYDATNAFIKTVDLLKGKGNSYWYATNGEIFKYTKALELLETDNSTYVKNNSDVTLYIKINGARRTILPGETIAS